MSLPELPALLRFNLNRGVILENEHGTLCWYGQHAERQSILVAEIERLRAKCEAMRVDAERYRWLRDPKRLEDASDDDGPGDRTWFIGESGPDRWGVAGEDADAAIDAARSAP